MADFQSQSNAETDTNHTAQYLTQLFNAALQAKASDIHIDPQSNHYHIRFRSQGILHQAAKLPTHFAIQLVTRLKVLANIDIAEKRLPQDGRIQLTTPHVIDIRLSTCPTLHGEKITLRLLNTNSTHVNIGTLGMTAEQQIEFQEQLSQPQGLILVSGPTGSGKTITLYSALNYLKETKRHIITAEDPIEIALPGVNQVAINANIGLNFATVLRMLLRQDPDVLMIGEIRDAETAMIACQAAQTGHLVLATLHANGTQESVARLESLSVDPIQLKQILTLTITQRLIRTLCNDCHDNLNTCTNCQDGYAGRTGIYEFSTQDLTLKQAAALKIQANLTTQSEIKRVLGI